MTAYSEANGRKLTRREVVGVASVGVAASALGVGKLQKRTIPIGVIGCGNRGRWIADLFLKHGGFVIHAVADYFPDVANLVGDQFGVQSDRRFSGLDGYKKLINSGVEAVVLETPPYCFPLHARAAVDANLHVFMAKPVAVDVPGCKAVEAAAADASRKRLVFLVDYQMPTDPGNIEVVRKIHAGAIGKPVTAHSYYLARSWPDPPRSRTIEDRLQNLIWVNDTAIGGGYHGNACVHALDAVLWALGRAPVAAMGLSCIGRPDPHGDSHDTLSLTYDFGNGLFVNHRAKHLPDHYSTADFCGCYIHGTGGYAWISYSAKAQLVSSSEALSHEVVNLYQAGAERNIQAFYEAIVNRDASNPTVRRSVLGALTTIMGREAALRRRIVTMADILRENRRLRLDLTGLRR